jgi:molybdopterin-containing oxidoreductase family iron-sulfur binding subunit
MALAGLATGCRRPEEKILPYTRRPEDLVDGRPIEFATSLPFYGTAIGLLVESTDGRPTKIEGNPNHPDSLGGTTALVQASVLDLYDPDRSTAPRHFVRPKDGGEPASVEVSMSEAWDFVRTFGDALKAAKGKGFAILLEETRSPTLTVALEALKRDLPEALVVRFEAFGRENARTGAQIAFGQPLETVHDLEKADVLLVLDGDLFDSEGSPIKAAKQFARRRKVESGSMSRVYVAEAGPTPTGTVADHRQRIQARQVLDLALAVASELGKHGVTVPPELTARKAGKLDDKQLAFAAAVAKDLAAAKGKGLVVAGRRQPPHVHALVHALNATLGNVGQTVRHVPVAHLVNEGAATLKQLVDSIEKREITGLLILGGNPAFNAPADAPFAALLERARKPQNAPDYVDLLSVHLGTHLDETGQLATWHIPRAHALESWSDTIAEDGTLAVTQPLIAPMYDGKTDAEVIERLLSGTRNAYELVRATWGARLGALGFEKAWRKVLHEGVLPLSAAPTVEVSLDAAKVGAAVGDFKAPEGAFEVVFAPDPHAYDGRSANNGWMQEMPDPIHKMCWMNAASISSATAQRLGLKDGQLVEVSVGGKSIKLPVAVTFGHADDSVTLTVGQGRRFEGRVCKGVGVDTQPLRTTAGFYLAAGTLAAAEGFEELAVTQGHFVLEGRPLVREQTTAQYEADPRWAKEIVQRTTKHPALENLWKDWEYNGHKWGMTIDLTLCTGCSACVTACQAENNIPVLGIAGVLKSREMHWLRIDRYFAGADGQPAQADDTMATNMPMTCQHCENAPCEQVCPVAATTHSPEGINEMTYNRCIGTKYCGNNCPYKVRRFNYFNYTDEIPETQKLVLNPDVTVRSRGVMEKCSFCVQRVNQAKIAAKKEKDAAKQREIVRSLKSACQQACPTEAITFGDLNDAEQLVAKNAALPRAYKALEEINVRPRISYLARIRNPNTDLEPAAASQVKPAGAQPHDGHGHAPGEAH